ncbi:MAG: hypothetical protein ACT4OT_02795 [Acidobacteriota bacterium]
MSEKKRTTVTTIETHEFWVLKRPAHQRRDILCRDCPDATAMLTLEEAAEQAGVSQRAVFCWVDEGAIHFAETATGELFVCLAPLTIDVG